VINARHIAAKTSGTSLLLSDEVTLWQPGDKKN